MELKDKYKKAIVNAVGTFLVIVFIVLFSSNVKNLFKTINRCGDYNDKY